MGRLPATVYKAISVAHRLRRPGCPAAAMTEPPPLADSAGFSLGCWSGSPLPWPGREPFRPEPAATAVPAGQEADLVPGEISFGEYRSLVRLAALLLYDASAAEDVVREALVAVHAGRRRPRDRGKALSCLRREVIRRSRLAVRHGAVAARTVPATTPGGPSAEPGAIALEHSAFLAALRSLPGRQREVIVLRYYACLPEGETAASMGISKGAVRHYTALGVAALKPVLEQDAP